MDRNKKGQYIEGHSSLNFKDLIGKKFGRLTVIKRSYPNTELGNAIWLCRCDCGKEKVIDGNSLRRGLTRSCGCLNIERASTSYRFKPGLSNMRQVIGYYKRNAKTRGYGYELTEEQFEEITQRDCYYCGVSPYNIEKSKKNGEYIYNGLDRIDNSKGYIVDNVVPCCKKCNYAKKGMSLREFRDWVKKVYDNFMGV